MIQDALNELDFAMDILKNTDCKMQSQKETIRQKVFYAQLKLATVLIPTNK